MCIQVEVLAISDDFVHLRAVLEPTNGGVEPPSDAKAAEGWARARNVTRVHRSSGLAQLRKQLTRSSTFGKGGAHLIAAATKTPDFLVGGGEGADEEEAAAAPAASAGAASSAAPAAAAAAAKEAKVGGSGGGSSSGKSVTIAAADPAAVKARAAEIAQWLKVALEKTNVRTADLFRDWDGAHKGHLEKADLVKALRSLDVLAYTDEELGQVFDCWDVRGAGVLDFRDVDRVIMRAKSAKVRARLLHASSPRASCMPIIIGMC